MNKNELKQSDESLIVPVMRYRDIDAAIEWLCATFGFEKHLVVTGEDGATFYAQLTYGTGMIMVGSGQNFELDPVLRQPQDIGGDETQCCYIVVGDVDKHYANTKAAGAEIVLDIKGDKSGGRGYSCRDPHGHIWNFGAYNPWKGKSAARADVHKDGNRSCSHWQFSAAFGCFLALFAALGTITLWATVSNEEDIENLYTQEMNEPLIVHEQQAVLELKTGPQSVKPTPEVQTEKSTKAEHEALERETTARKEAEQKLNVLREDLERLKQEQQNAQEVARLSKEELARERKIRQELEQTLLALRREVERESKLSQDFQERSQELQRDLEAIRAERIAALKAAEDIKESLRLETAAKQTLQQELREAKLETREALKAQKALKARQSSSAKRRKHKAAKRRRKTAAKRPKKKKIPKLAPTPGIFGFN